MPIFIKIIQVAQFLFAVRGIYMAIKILSKDIYDISNEIVRKNVIDKVETKQTAVNVYKSQNEPVYAVDITGNVALTKNVIDKSLTLERKETGIDNNRCFVGVIFEVDYAYKDIEISFPRKKFDETIYKVYDGASSDGKSKIKLTINKYIQSGYRGFAGSPLNSSDGSFVGEKSFRVSDSNWVFDSTVDEMPKSIEFKASYITSSGLNKNIEHNIDYSPFVIPDEENIKTQKIVLDTATDEYKVSLRVLYKVILYRYSGYNPYYNEAKVQGYVNIQLTGAEKYELTKVTIFGDKYEIDLQEQVKVLGDGSHVYAIEGNELLQTTNTYLGENAVEKQAQNIINEYENGKETATILCSFGNYYNTKNELAISLEKITTSVICSKKEIVTLPLGVKIHYVYFSDINKKYENQSNIIIPKISSSSFPIVEYSKSTLIPTIKIPVNTIVFSKFIENTEYDTLFQLPFSFDIDDEVIPYIHNAQNIDVPMSLKKNGSPKVFKVVGTHLFYDGVPWQELMLLEKTN